MISDMYIFSFCITVLMPNLKKQEDDLQLLATVNTNFDDVSVSITHKLSLFEVFFNVSLHYHFYFCC